MEHKSLQYKGYTIGGLFLIASLFFFGDSFFGLFTEGNHVKGSLKTIELNTTYTKFRSGKRGSNYHLDYHHCLSFELVQHDYVFEILKDNTSKNYRRLNSYKKALENSTELSVWFDYNEEYPKYPKVKKIEADNKVVINKWEALSKLNTPFLIMIFISLIGFGIGIFSKEIIVYTDNF